MVFSSWYRNEYVSQNAYRSCGDIHIGQLIIIIIIIIIITIIIIIA